jgi:hypothetical protein
MRLVTRFIYTLSCLGFFSNVVHGEGVTQVLSCKVKTIGPMCGSGEVSLLMSNGKFRLQNGDVRCWGADLVSSGDLEPITQTLYSGTVAKGYEMKGAYSSHQGHSVLGQVYVSTDQSVARIILAEQKPFVSMASDYHLVCHEELRDVITASVDQEVCFKGWGTHGTVRDELEKMLVGKINSACKNQGYSVYNRALVLSSDFSSEETSAGECPFGLSRFTLTSKFICSNKD